ncbi:ABC transporter ATP-binding protein [Cohnella zeiphila]|uniref:ABC transporter ATP-binding protein n=1 Tax=Cohnella zeiphila TaxID=2761120 RepID=A0A7X0SLM5_9BACL|nr:ABC transporter ATP-binding protein [Cohnella zeiphila]MBB6732283.1 ABC transporter ATP-binding protein [Cohnella zeiphila]
MSSDTAAISIQNVSKIFKVYNKPQDRLWQGLFKSKKKLYREFWAINDLTFTVKKGECIGIIGRNGSGKSTILQIIAKTLKPTSGQVEVNGRVSALLELGSGFNPEFTGRENVMTNGVIMGLSIDEVMKKMPEIEAFAEIGEFIDQPVKTYSSGMFVRLAFACAIHVNPDILIIDEALAVGDMRFQLKCIERLKKLKSEGKTILFVSHDSFMVRNFCDQAIWMMDGKIHLRGDVNTVTEQYQDFMKYEGDQQNSPALIGSPVTHQVLVIDKVNIKNTDNKDEDRFKFGDPFSVEISYTLKEKLNGIVGGVAIYDKQNNYICGLNTKLDSINLPTEPGEHQLVLNYSEMKLLPGTYFIDIGFFESSAVVILDYKSRHKMFHVHSGEYFAEGLTFIEHSWSSKESVQKRYAKV